MKIVIDIPNYNLNDVKNGSIACGRILEAVKTGTPYEERPKGEWIIDEEWVTPTDDVNDDYKVTTYTCPFCGKVEYEPFGYCRCGAKLEKGGAE